MSTTPASSNDPASVKQEPKAFTQSEKYEWQNVLIGTVPPVPPIPDGALGFEGRRTSRRASYAAQSIKSGAVVERPVSTASTLAGWAGNVRTTRSDDPRRLQAIWDSSPSNPRNWSQIKKLYTASSSIIASTIACMSSTTVMPAQPELGHTFNSTQVVISLSVGLYLLGLSCGPFLCACSAGLTGRKPLSCASLFLLFGFLIGAAFAPTLAGLLILRFLAGLVGSIPAYLPTLVLQDLWATKERPIPLTTYYVFNFLGPILGFVLGSPIVQAGHWRWSQFLLTIFAGCSFILTFTTSETQRQAIYRRNLRGHGVIPSMRAGLDSLATSLQSLVNQPVILMTTAHTSVAMGASFVILQAFTLTFREAFRIDVAKQGLVLFSMVVGLLLGVLCLFVFDSYVYALRADVRRAEADADAQRLTGFHKRSGRSSRAVTVPERISNRKSSTSNLKEVQRGSRTSIATSLRRLASKASMTEPESPPLPDNEKNIHLSIACANYLNSIPGNEGRRIMPERILLLLNKTPAFGDLCMALDGYHLRYDRVKLAKVLVDAVEKLSSNSTAEEKQSMPALVRSKSMHQEAALAALEEPEPPLPIDSSSIPGMQTRRMAVPCEWRLWLSLPASILSSGALFMLGWTTSTTQSLAAGVTALGLFAFSLPLIHIPTMRYVADRYRSSMRDAALNGMVLVQYTISFGFTLAAYPLYSALGIGWATSVLAFILLVLGSVPWLLYFCPFIFKE